MPGHDQFRVWVRFVQAVDDGLEIAPQGFDALTPQHVVGAEFQHQDGDGLAQQPVDAPQPARRRVPTHPGVDDPIAQAPCVDLLLDASGKGVARREAVARGQARAEKQDHSLIRFGARARCLGTGGASLLGTAAERGCQN